MKKIFWALIILTVVSCREEETLPEGYMSKEEMASFLIDLHVGQSTIQTARATRDSAAFLFKVFERHILEKHGTDDSTFYKSFSWYLDHPDDMYEIYTVVVDTISLRESLSRRADRSE